MRGVDGAELGTVQDIYRVGENEVFVVGGGPYGSFDLPAVRAFIRIFAPRRGEIVVDAEALDLRPPRERRADPDRPRAPRRTARRRRPAAGDAARGSSRPDSGDRRHPSTAPTRRRRAMTLEIDVLTLFPAMFEGPLRREHPGTDPGAGARRRSASTTCASGGSGRHRSVDDAPYGGGAGMVLRPEPVAAALDALRRPDSTVILLDPVGEVFRQARAADLATRSHLDLRLPALRGRRRADPRRWSTSSSRSATTSLTGGELPALVVIDAVIRLLPGAIEAASTAEESFATGLLEYPQYTRPAVVPRHGRPGDPDVGRSRRGRALAPTSRRANARACRRPDLLPRTTSARRARALGRTGSPCYTPRAGRPLATASERPTRSLGCPPEQGTAA